MATSAIRPLMLTVALSVMIGLVGCGGSSTTKTITETSAASPTTAANTTSANSAVAQNNAVISSASTAPDARAQLGAARIQQILTAKLGMNGTLSFNLSHHIAPDDNGGDAASSSEQTP